MLAVPLVQRFKSQDLLNISQVYKVNNMRCNYYNSYYMPSPGYIGSVSLCHLSNNFETPVMCTPSPTLILPNINFKSYCLQTSLSSWLSLTDVSA